MQNLKPILVIAIVAGIITWFMPWWMIAVTAFVVTVNHKLLPKRGFVCGFCGIAMAWFAIALWRDIPNEHILSNRMAGLLGLPNGWLFMLVTILIGGLVGGLSGLTGGLMNKAFRKA